MGCATFIGLVVISVAFGTCQGERESRQTATREQHRVAKLTPEQRTAEAKRKAAADKARKDAEALRDAVYMCRTFIKRSLRDPDSAEFELAEDSYSKAESPGIYHVQVDGRAKNGFGGYNRSTWDCRLADVGNDKWTLMVLKEIN
jgi:hypothetical protein